MPFRVAHRRGDQITSKQLRDDLMTMLIAGHETTAAVLTWTTYLLAQHPDVAARVRAEVDQVRPPATWPGLGLTQTWDAGLGCCARARLVRFGAEADQARLEPFARVTPARHKAAREGGAPA